MSTAVLVVSRPANMPNYNNSNHLEEVSSHTSFSQFSAASNAPGMFSFAPTEPSTGLIHGPAWVATEEESQKFQDFPDNGSPSGDAEEYIFTSGHTTPRGSRLDQCQTTGVTWSSSTKTAPEISPRAHAMSRIGSGRSSSSTLTQLSKPNINGNVPTFHTGSDATGSLSGMDSCLLLESTASAVPSQIYWSDYSLDLGLNTDGGAFPLPNVNPLHVSPAQMHLGADPGVPDNSSTSSWDFSSPISQTSSPATIDDAWLPAAVTPRSSPRMESKSTSTKINMSVMSGNTKGITTRQTEDNQVMPAMFSVRRVPTEGDSARDHHLYKSAVPKPDGLFHCPWEGLDGCNHKPEKLKCNYDKYVDSHLKPYRCKIESCEGARFSSTACLLRHEREAHGMHGHGAKPFLCIHQGCDRAIQGNGFPRQWNLRDHMKRVHNDHSATSAGAVPSSTPTLTPAQPAPIKPAPLKQSASNKPSAQVKQSAPIKPSTPAKGRKRKTDAPDAQTTPARKTSVKSKPAPEVKQESAKPLLEQWMDHRKAVEGMIRGLNKPEDSKTLQQIIEVERHLNVMAKMTSAFSAAPSISSSGRKNHNSGG